MTEKPNSGRGQRELRVRVKTAKGRKLSSTLWLERQLNDPYVIRAKKEGYRGRAAYKILELDDRYGFLKPGARVVDLGCAPGGWCQVAVARVNALGQSPKKPVGTVLGVDLQEVEPISGAEIHQLDFLADDADGLVKGWLGGRADVVMSDMAASASGTRRPTICGSWRWSRRPWPLPSTCWKTGEPSSPRCWRGAPRTRCRRC
jgi:23S rRNA (uridine2552-2'-O)-methyltransferase